MTNFTVKIISDNVCPFCYLGKARLDKAIAAHQRKAGPSDKFAVSWSAYYLDPSAPKTSRPVREALADKFGPDRIGMMEARVRQMGASEGIDFSFQGRTGATRDSHRVAQLAKARGGDEAQDKVVREMMKMYFEEGGDITAAEDLAKAAEKGAGIAPEETKAWLKEGKGGEEVDREVQEAYRLGVRGVPRFIINDKFEVTGAEDVSVFLEQFHKAKKAAEA